MNLKSTAEYIQLQSFGMESTLQQALESANGSIESGFLDLPPEESSPVWLRKLIKGPDFPQDNAIPRIAKLDWLELIPDKFHSRFSKPIKIALAGCYFLFWLGLCLWWLNPYFFTIPYLANDANTEVMTLTCGASELWAGKNQQCGLNGTRCPSVDEDKDIVIRCPALCDQNKAYTMIPVGDQLISYRGFYIGGGNDIVHRIDDNQVTNPYRGDSFPCVAGVHAGLISPLYGGCARLSFNSKQQASFPSAPGHHVAESLQFMSFFKSSFYFKKDKDDGFINCFDPRYPVTFINILFGIPIAFLGSGAFMFWTLSVVGFWTVCLTMDPIISVDPSNPENFAEMISIAAERFLPTCFILYVLWHFSVKETLTQKSLQDEEVEFSYVTRFLCWYPFFWVGVLNNITFDRLPIDRFSFEGLSQQPGGVLTMVLMIVLVVICAIIQGYSVWRAGKLSKYLKFYCLMFVIMVVIASIPGFSFHLHHYILAIILLPGCGTKGRTALMFSGLLLGLFISGASRWGLASIVETLTMWKRGDPLGKILPPEIISYDAVEGILSILPIPRGVVKNSNYDKYSAISLLVNDIEAFVGNGVTSINLKQLFSSAAFEHLIPSQQQITIYLRIGRKIPNTSNYGDFSRAAILSWPQGNLILPPPGVT